MAISRIYTKTAGEIITEALRDSRIIPAEQPVSAVDYQNGLNSLNNVSKYWQTQGLFVWLMDRAVLPLNQGQKVYELGPDGDPCGYEDTFFDTTIDTAAVTGATTLDVVSTLGMEAAPGILTSSPVISTQGWDSVNSGVLTVSSGIVITNSGANAGGGEYELAATVGQTYRVRFTYTQGTSAGCVFSVLNGTTVEDTVTLTGSADGELEITAALDTIIFRAQNTSAVAGQTSTVAALQYVDDITGSRIGIQLDDGTTQWSYVLDVDSSTSVVIKDALTDDVASGNFVYSFTEQIDRPLKLFNATYATGIEISEIPVDRWSRQEYTQQPDKSSQGTVNQWYYNPTLELGKLYVWQTAPNNECVLRFDVRKPLAVYEEISDSLDYPSEYYMALKWSIAADIGPSYGVKESAQALLEQKAFMALEAAQDNDNELDSIYLAPNFSGG
jgi:hypothetical protein